MKAARWQTVMSLVRKGPIAVLTASAGLGEQGMAIGLSLMNTLSSRFVFTRPFCCIDLLSMSGSSKGDKIEVVGARNSWAGWFS